MTTKRTLKIRKDGVSQHYLTGRALGAEAREAVAKPPFAPPAPLAPAHVDYASLVSDPGVPSDSFMEPDPYYRREWKYNSGLKLDRRTGEVNFWTVDPDSAGTTFDEHLGHVLTWQFLRPLAGTDKYAAFVASREDLGRVTDGYDTEWNGQNLVGQNAENGTDWKAVYGRIQDAINCADSGPDWVQDQEIEEDGRIADAVDALVLDGVDSSLSWGDSFGEAYLTLTDKRTGVKVTEPIVEGDLDHVVALLKAAVEEHDADA